MALDLFRVHQGLNIELDSGLNANILVGSGTPGGDAGEQDSSPIGTIYLRTDTETDGLQLYWKHSTTNNSSADWKQSTDKDYVDAVASGLSWREPARVRDNTSYASSSAFPTTGTIDGVALNDGDRVLFDNVGTSGENNVWIWDAGTTSWTEDTNTETDGDALLVQEGTSAERQYVYDGAQWVLFGSSAGAAELGYIRSYIGKTGPGSESPTYSSTDVVTQTSNLETAIGDLDNAMGDGEITNAGGNYSLSDDMSWGATGTLEVTDAFNELNDSIGNRSYTEDNVVTDGEAVSSSIDAIDIAVGSLQDQSLTITGTNVVASGGVTVDTLPLADATEAKWMVQVRENGTPANRRSAEIHAMNDGSTLADHTVYGILTLGSAIAGLNVNVDINGTDMRLRLTATNNIDYVVKRIGYSSF